MQRLWRVGLAWEIHHRFGDDAIRGIAEYANRFGPWQCFMNPIHDFDIRKNREHIEVDGILLGHTDIAQVAATAWPKNIPIVAVHRNPRGVAPWQANNDNAAIGRLVAEDFVRRGFRNFAYCPDTDQKPPHNTWDYDRLQGFRIALEKTGAEVGVFPNGVGPWEHLEYKKDNDPLALWLCSLPKPVAIMAATDWAARHVLRSAEAAEIRVPEEVAIIGVYNEAWTELLFRGLSTVELDGFRAGYVAAEMLHQLMEGKPLPPQIKLIAPRRLVTRRSSSTVAIDDPDVLLAVHFIAEHATKGISIRKVVDAVPLSRRSLERRFHRALGHSILHEIQSVQVERAKLLLVDETVPLRRVAGVSGFSSVNAMRAVFNRLTGMPPTSFRKSLRG